MAIAQDMATQPPSHAGQQSHVFIAEAKEAVGTGNLVAMQRYATEGTKEDLVSFWTRCIANNDSATATAIVKLLSAMLLKCDGETGWSALGATCVRRVLAEHTKSILRNVSSGKAVYINPTLRLLITMVNYDVGSLANEVYAAVDISNFKGWPKLLNRAGPPRKEQKVSLGKRKREENTSSKEAVRGLFAEFYFALLHNLQPTLKAELLSHRQFTTELFKHIGQDDAFTLNKAIKGMTLVVETHDVPRTAKVKFFNEWTLERLVLLYNKDFAADEEEDADHLQTQSRQTLQTFFLRATTIPNEGISFASYGLHPPASFPKIRLFNPILGAFCLTLKPLADNLQLELLLKMLASTPELIAHFLNNANLDLDPQLEVSWIGAMRLLDSILALPLPEDYDTGIVDLQPVPAKIKADNVLPSNLSKVLVKGLQHESDLVKLMTAKTFWSALKKLMTSRSAGIVDDTVLELVQSRCPDLQIVLKLATQSTTAETSEELVLLREVCILLLNAYITLFEDIPSFDFATLFKTILLPDEGTLVTDKERDTVVGMVSLIRGLPWLQRKKDTESVFATLLQNVIRLNTSDDAARRATSLHVLDALIREESFMFSETPVSKSEALLRSLQPFEPSEQQLLVRFAEECFIRFQATPYRYYDQLVAWAARNEEDITDLTATMSCILLTLKEQLQYQTSSCVSRWLVSFCDLLANTGDDWTFCEHIAGQQIDSIHDCNELSLWNAQWLVVYLGDAQREYLPATVDKWTLLQEAVDVLNETDLQVLKAWLLKRWLRALLEQPDENILLMQFVVSLFSQADVAQMPDLAHLLKSQLISGSSLVDCSSLVPAELASLWLSESLENGITAFHLLPCLDRAHPVTGQQLSILLDKASTDETALQKIAGLLRSGAIIKDNVVLLGRSVTNTPCPEAMAGVLAELVKEFPSTIEQALQFAKAHGPQTAAPLLVELLSFDETNASVLAILQDHEDYYCKTDLSKEANDTCLLALLHRSTRLRQQLSKQLTVSSSLLGLRVFVALQSHDDSSDDKQAVAYMQQVFDGLTRSFAEDRAEENKLLSEGTLAYVHALATSITQLGPDRLVKWVSVNKLAPLVEAALANQIQHRAVIRLLAALASASFEAFPYAKSAQTILAHQDALLLEETRVPLAELLLRMLQNTPTCASIAWLDEIVKVYSGSLDAFDQVLFKLLQALEATLRVSVGSRIKHWRLEEFRASESQSADGPARAKAVEVVLSKHLAYNTITHFNVCMGMAREPQQVYNLRFILPVIAGFLYADESMEQLRLLLDHHALGLVFLGLAHPEHEVRCVASSTLALFDRLIRASKLREKLQLETLLSALQNATTVDLCSIAGKPLPLLTAVFLASAIPVLTMSSGIHLYDKLNRFLLSRPALDLLDVPMLMTLFYSSGAGPTGAGDYGKEIVWLLRMLVAGFADESVLSAHIQEEEALPCAEEVEVDGEAKQPHASLFLEPYKRRHVLPLIMGLFTARTATMQIKNLALDLVARLVASAYYAAQCQKRGGAVRLLQRYGIRVWLAIQKALLQNESTGSDAAGASSKRVKEGTNAARRRADANALLARLTQLESQMEEISSMQ